MQTFTRDELTFDVTDAGLTDGEVVVLLHGFPQDRQAWDGITPLLNKAGYRTLAPDQRGYTAAATPGGRMSFKVDQLAQDIVVLIDTVGAASAHVVGHDWGAVVAWKLAERHADRVASVTVLSTPHPAAMAWAFAHSNQWKKSLYMVFFQFPWIAERLMYRQLPGLYIKTGMSQQDAHKYAERFPTPESLTGPLGWYRSIPSSQTILKSMKYNRDQSKGVDKEHVSGSILVPAPRPKHAIQVPTSYVWGSRDFAFDQAAAEKTAEFVSAEYEFVNITGAGHWLPEVNADEVTDVIIRRARSTAPASRIDRIIDEQDHDDGRIQSKHQ